MCGGINADEALVVVRRIPVGDCHDGIDNDGDGFVDDPEDPGCAGPNSPRENPQCSDGIDNDGDGKLDWDGAGVGAKDPQCLGPAGNKERSDCGLGFELALALPLLEVIRRRRRSIIPGAPLT
jgi:hypothetical protein